MSVIERLLRRDDGGGHFTVGPLTIEPMQRRDVRRGVMAIEALSYPKPWSQGVFESELAQVRSGTRRYLVARRHDGSGRGRGQIVGYAGLWFTADEAHVTNVAVQPAQQRSGVATALMIALAEEAIDRGCAAWTLEVRVSSAGAQELYRRFGFNPAGVRARYYENTEDAIVMWCNDIQRDDYRRLIDSIRADTEQRWTQ
ncbi:MAG TPA: ribosomal protein S18-alanine N-acetyltransferase [Ilumatobacteraceae bacterium]|nr:ribosomal protein S18-alanine N-acetyltransferase [Ilumatobacteraceae bacterium]